MDSSFVEDINSIKDIEKLRNCREEITKRILQIISPSKTNNLSNIIREKSTPKSIDNYIEYHENFIDSVKIDSLQN